MEYEEEDFLQLSGVQHFLFCRRQWALIHIENQWAENGKTMDGRFFHKNAHNGMMKERRGNLLIARGLYIHSRALGLTGQCDIVEFHQDPNGIQIQGEKDLWVPYPVEYKRGRKKYDICDEAQVCAQAMCLEEMYCCNLSEGAIFYGETRRRYVVPLNDSLRERVVDAVRSMHDLYRRGTTPKAHVRKGCQSCSLRDVCIPELQNSEQVSDYLTRLLREA